MKDENVKMIFAWFTRNSPLGLIKLGLFTPAWFILMLTLACSYSVLDAV